MSARPVIVLGGYGVFGSQVACHLARAGLPLTIAGRSAARARRFAGQLGQKHRGIALDVRDDAACRQALKHHRVAVHCAGPFGEFDQTLLEACLDAGCHYVDIADDRRYAALVRSCGPRFAAAGLTAAGGCSSLPGISGAVALVLREREALDDAVGLTHVRVTLFIGNRNPKGLGAVRAAARLIGRPISAPQGPLRGFGDPRSVALGAPFGTRRVRNFESPEYDLFPPLLNTPSVTVKVGFELPGATALFGMAARWAPGLGRRLMPQLARAGRLLSGVGRSGGVVMTELFDAAGVVAHGAMAAARNGQRLAALPAAYVAEHLCRETDCPVGAVTAYEALGAEPLVERLVADGYEFRTHRRR